MNINFFWIGESIDKMGQLSLKSFLDYDHNPILWTYNLKCKNIPSGVQIKDAGEILHPDHVFSYKGNGDCRKGSYGGFSDIFRYHLLQKVGGWYCDMDVTCLDNFSNISVDEYVFRPHLSSRYVGNIMKCPSNNEFLEDCIKTTELEIKENNDSWMKPVIILRDCIEKHNLQKNVVPENYFGNDDIMFLKKIVEIPFLNNQELPKYAIHWCNEAVSFGFWNKTIRRDWNKPIPTTLYYKLLKKHKLL